MTKRALSGTKSVNDRNTSVQSLRRAFGILEVFSIQKPQLNITEISALVALPRSTVTRLVSSLVDMGYLQRDKSNLKYSLGSKLCWLGTIAAKSRELTDTAEPILRELRDKYEETTYVDVVDGFERVCVLSLEGNQAIRMVVPVGHRTPLYAGSDGRVLLANQPDQKINDYLKTNHLEPNTPNTITDLNTLWKELERVRQNGFAISYGEWCIGSVGISAPIYNHNQEVIAALSMSVPDYRASKKVVLTFLEAVREAAMKVSTLLGFSDFDSKSSHPGLDLKGGEK